jgi:hypothetical protein
MAIQESTPHWWYWPLGAVAGAVIGVTLVFWKVGAEPASAPESARAGVGAPLAAPAITALPARVVPQTFLPQAVNVSTDQEPPDQPALNDKQKLVVNKALLYIFHFYLLTGNEGGRKAHADQLRAYLKNKLPPSAQDDALQLVQHYLAYMDAHDGLLARQGIVLPTPDTALPPYFIERIATWVEQRARLRQTELGIEVAQTWFGEEENQARRIIAGLRKRSEPDPIVDADGGQQPQFRTHGTEQIKQFEVDVQEFSQKLTVSFASSERDEQQFKIHFGQYTHALAQLGTLEPVELFARMDVLRPQYLLTEAERERARALGK